MRALGIGLLMLAGCAPRLGTECDIVRAREIAYSPGGTPAYAGQSILITSCAGGGSFCHSDVARARYGAPFGMDFDPVLADDPRFSDYDAGLDHLSRAQVASNHLHQDIWQQVVSGAMPPGAIGIAASTAPYRTYADASDVDGTAIPGVRTAEGRELLRNWLACGSPLIEATTFPTFVHCDADADCTRTHHCDVAQGLCANVGYITPAFLLTSPHWGSLYATVVMPSCALAICHGTAGAAASGNLDLSTQALGYEALVGVASASPNCGTRIVPGDPDTSLLLAKVEGTQDHTECGDTMPIGGMLGATQLDALRTWIQNGALND